MASVIDICNLALGHIGTRSTISSLTEKSNEARQCNIMYPLARDYVIRQHPWKWAQKRIALADVGDPPQDWEYRYAYPSDCLKANEVVPAAGERNVADPIPFELIVGDDLKTIHIVSDSSDVVLRYTARVEVSTLFDASFVQMLAAYLASQLAFPLTGKKDIKNDMLSIYDGIRHDAWATDRNEGERDQDRNAEWLTARN